MRRCSVRGAEPARGHRHRPVHRYRLCHRSAWTSTPPRPGVAAVTTPPQLRGALRAVQSRVEENRRASAAWPSRQVGRPSTGDIKNALMTSIPHRYRARLGAAVLLATAMGPLPSLAQQLPPQGQPGRAQAPPKGPASPPARDSAPASDSALRQRIEQLEEQLVDMQVVVGTLESLARGATAPASPAGGRQIPGPAAAIGAADARRLHSIETQIQAPAAPPEHPQGQG